MALVDGIGCWAELRSAPTGEPRAALFLDRDGVIVEDTGFMHRPEDVDLIPGAADTIAAFNGAGVPVVIVTNQSGIARGIYDWDAFVRTQAEIERQLDARGAHVDGVFACGYHPSATGVLYADDHPWRKPNPGMLSAAADRLHLDLRCSWLVGDRVSDIAAARHAGAAGALHVRTGQGTAEQNEASARQAGHTFSVEHGDSISAARGLLARISKGLPC